MAIFYHACGPLKYEHYRRHNVLSVHYSDVLYVSPRQSCADFYARTDYGIEWLASFLCDSLALDEVSGIERLTVVSHLRNVLDPEKLISRFYYRHMKTPKKKLTHPEMFLREAAQSLTSYYPFRGCKLKKALVEAQEEMNRITTENYVFELYIKDENVQDTSFYDDPFSGWTIPLKGPNRTKSAKTIQMDYFVKTGNHFEIRQREVAALGLEGIAHRVLRKVCEDKSFFKNI